MGSQLGAGWELMAQRRGWLGRLMVKMIRLVHVSNLVCRLRHLLSIMGADVGRFDGLGTWSSRKHFP